MAKQKRREDLLTQGREKYHRSKRESQKSANNDVDFSNSVINDVEADVSTTSMKSHAIFVLEHASIRKGFVRKKRKILSANEDGDFLTRQGENLNDYRPNIFYERFSKGNGDDRGKRLSLGRQGSPLNKAGMVGAVYVKTDSGVLFEVKPHTRIPRTCKRFCGIMLELLEKSRVCAKDTGDVLIQVLKKPLAHYIPENAKVVGLSYSSQKVVDIEDYVSAASDDSGLVVVVGTMVNGKVSKDLKDDYISVSDYPLSAKCCVGVVCEALEKKWVIF